MKLSDLNTKIDTESYGTIELFGLMIKDIGWLHDPKTKKLPARDFTVHLMQSHLISPTLDFETVNGWSDDFLLSVATRWLKDQQYDSTKSLPSLSSFDEFEQAVYAYNEELTEGSKKLFDSFAKSQQQLTTNLISTLFPITKATDNIFNFIAQSSINRVKSGAISDLSNLRTVLSQVTPKITDNLSGVISTYSAGIDSIYRDILKTTNLVSDTLGTIVQRLSQPDFTPPSTVMQQIFAGLPDLTEYAEFWKEVQEANRSFGRAGFGFLDHFISFRTVQRFASVHPNARHAAITNSLVATTRRKNFEEKLHKPFQRSSVLSRRWKSVEQALDAHRKRNYYVSVPALLAQVEGVIGDALLLKNLVHREGNELYLKENGKIKVGKKGDRVKASGLDSLIRHSKWKDDAVLHGVADLIITQLAQERNGIMHGRKIDYGTAKLSVQGLLLLFVLANTFVNFETGQS
jgi:hypothetical protein